MFIVRSSNLITRSTTPLNSIDGRDRLAGLDDIDYVHYLFFSSNLGAQYTEAQLQNIFKQYVGILNLAHLEGTNSL
jgi:hypothetical protein